MQQSKSLPSVKRDSEYERDLAEALALSLDPKNNVKENEMALNLFKEEFKQPEQPKLPIVYDRKKASKLNQSFEANDEEHLRLLNQTGKK